ncbi:apolipoprotein N-acyltransferase [Malonomonas rubra DSM 5091]|uniref:Apolipoprotein N-acyltransferase n=1 Tax=Malonomonas rubra DSM 5091 TaxID=1122189 RepID=A0A1M6DYM5_MALRU|nr:apolipoprotein N-acyltransferase [Malonomonas rubra]SHI78352.1 apolipoprotein N-acyltransferase [Malonomonas rubra DSM 5091]
MNRLPGFDRTLIFSAASGLLLAAAFPRPDFYPLAWIGLIPLLLVMRKRPFASGFACGFSFFASVLYWLNLVMTTYGGLNWIFALLAYLFLIVYLALYFGAASWLSCSLEKHFKIPVLLSMPVAWVALEYLRGMLLTGFPWALLGYSQHDFSAAIQSADVTGVFGVSLLLVAFNCALAWIIRQPRNRCAWLGLAGTLAMTVTHCGYGVWRQGQPLDLRLDQLQVALVQGNIDQAIKWDPAYRQATLDKYLKLSQEAGAGNLDLLIWPEAATPFFLQEKTPQGEQVRQVPQGLQTNLLVGSPAYEKLADKNYRYYNRAYLLSPAGEDAGYSDKIHLVPFGEYVPLGRLLTFINKLVVGVGDFAPGTVNPLSLNGHQLGVLICYEVIFPELARDYVRQGSDLLVNLTNDAWFGRSSAPYQHLAMARFRAIENRIWLARSANTGISGFIAPSGKVTAASPLFKELVVSGRVGLGSQQTFYTRFGPVMAQGCLAMTFLACAGLVWRIRREL